MPIPGSNGVPTMANPHASRACALRAKFADKPILAAYKAQRAHKLTGRDRTARTASAALSFARQDVESGRIASTPAVGVVTYQPDSPKRYAFAPRPRLAHVENPEAFGFRFVGYVTPESYGGRDSFRDTQEHGWLTDPCGDVFKDGSGLCTGVVYQLAGSRGESRFVAGYQFGGIDGGPTLDLSEVFSFGTADEWAATDNPGAREAARRADDMAKDAGERERDYQCAWTAGSQYGEALAEVKSTRREALALLKEIRAARARDAGSPAICAALQSAVRAARASIAANRSAMARLAAGDDSQFPFYPSDEHIAAFCEGAGLDTYPA